MAYVRNSVDFRISLCMYMQSATFGLVKNTHAAMISLLIHVTSPVPLSAGYTSDRNSPSLYVRTEKYHSFQTQTQWLTFGLDTNVYIMQTLSQREVHARRLSSCTAWDLPKITTMR
jgi:hypothetical protein